MFRTFLALLFMAGVAAAQDTIMYGAGDLVGNRFVLKTVNGKEISSPMPIHVEWNSSSEMAGRICNLFRGKCLFLNNLIKVEDIAVTRMACPNQELAELENKLLGHFRNGMSFIAFDGMLEMRRDDSVLVFEKAGPAGQRPADKPAAAPDGEKQPEAAAPDKTAPTKTEPTKTEPAKTEPAKTEPDKAESTKTEPTETAQIDAATAEKEAAELAKALPAPAPIVPRVDEENLIGRVFVLRSFEGEPLAIEPGGTQPFIRFGEGFRINGSACNNFMGQGELRDGVLRIPHAASTMMLCPDPELSEYERIFHKMMGDGAVIELSGDTLILTSDGKTHVFAEKKDGR